VKREQAVFSVPRLIHLGHAEPPSASPSSGTSNGDDAPGLAASATERADLPVRTVDIRRLLVGYPHLDDELRRRDDRVTGKERIEAAARLGRAGYSDEEIVKILGPAEPNDENTDEKVDMDGLTPEHAVVDDEDDEPVGEDLDELLREVLGSRANVAVYVALRETEHDEPIDIAEVTGVPAERDREYLRES
jgi:hypothetical protein